MLLGMPVATFTLLHVIISLIGIAAGGVVGFGLLQARSLHGWTALFLAMTALTDLTLGWFATRRSRPSPA